MKEFKQKVNDEIEYAANWLKRCRQQTSWFFLDAIKILKSAKDDEDYNKAVELITHGVKNERAMNNERT